MALWVNPLAEVLEDDDPAPFDGWSVLLAAIEDRRPEWQLDAACRYAEGVSFFPERGEPVEPARALCASCPVAGPCAAYRDELGPAVYGVWAGQSAATARRHRRAA
jgi:hypothetical protein